MTIHRGSETTNMIKCKKYGKGLAMKLNGGWCVCYWPTEECRMESEFGPGKPNKDLEE